MSHPKLHDDAFAKINCFRDLSLDEARQLASFGEVEQHPAGECILLQGRTSQNLWIVLDGVCEVFCETEGKEVVLAELEPYAQFGEMSFYRSAPHSASIRAKSPLEVLRIRRDQFDKFAEQHPAAAYKLACNVIGNLAERLRRMDDWVARLHDGSPEKKPRTPEWDQLREKMLLTTWGL